MMTSNTVQTKIITIPLTHKDLKTTDLSHIFQKY
jgi:hypothetical protein